MFEFNEIVLALVCLVVAIFNAAVGSTGGVTFAAMATLLPASAVVPIHGLVEGFSSSLRWAMLHQSVNYRFLTAFIAGGLIGFVAGWPLIGRLSDSSVKLMLGIFLIVMVWMPFGFLKLRPSVAGAFTSSLTLLVGATGPLVSSILMRHESKHHMVIATQGACTAFQHTTKVLLFGFAGFSFSPYVNLIVLLSGAIIVGTAIGKRILIVAPTQLLRVVLKCVISLLAIRLIFYGLGLAPSDISIGSWPGVAVISGCLLLGGYAGYQIRLIITKVKHFRELKIKCTIREKGSAVPNLMDHDLLLRLRKLLK